MVKFAGHIEKEERRVLKWVKKMQGDSKLLSGFLWPIHGNLGNNFESPCRMRGWELSHWLRRGITSGLS
jgi:hypothetical protein